MIFISGHFWQLFEIKSLSGKKFEKKSLSRQNFATKSFKGQMD
jgi:hypothetical protein